MLINTVILFLRDVLPVFIIASLLLVHSKYLAHHKPRADENHWLYFSLAIGLVFAILLTLVSNSLSSAIEGAGNEVFYAIGHLSIYLAIAALLCNTVASRSCYYIIIITTLMLYGASFIIFISAFWTQYGAAQAMIIGIVLGVGICISIAILLYFIMAINHPRQQKSISIIMLAFASGQLIITTNLLSQIDFIPSSAILWNSNFLLDEQGEIGQLLTALAGYDATPTAQQLIICITAVIAPLIYIDVKKALSLTKEGR